MLMGPVHVGWIRVDDVEGARVYRAIGTAHRRPVSRRIPASTARRLVAAGVPVFVARRSPAERPRTHRYRVA